jgi:hypothetical protein
MKLIDIMIGLVAFVITVGLTILGVIAFLLLK